MENQNSENNSAINIIITVFVIIIIIGLAVLFYYFAVKAQSISYGVNMAGISVGATKTKTTEVIKFQVPDILPDNAVLGSCESGSLVQPYRQDALRCKVNNSVYDPCFKTNYGSAFCQPNPLEQWAILIVSPEGFSEIETPKEINENWAWFVELEDGTLCAPFEETQTFAAGEIAYYKCESKTENEMVVLMSELQPGEVWKAKKATLEKSDDLWEIKQSETVSLKAVWQ